MSRLRMPIAASAVLLLGTGAAYLLRPERPVPTWQADNPLFAAGLRPTQNGLEIIHDLGPVIADDRPSLKLNLPFTNLTGEELRITKVSHCCGVAVATVGATVLAPGEKTTVGLEVNLLGRSGPQVFSGNLHDANGIVWAVRARLPIHERLRFAPPDGLRLGPFEPNALVQGTAQLVVSACQVADFPRALDVQCSDKRVQLKWGKAVEDAPAGGIVCRKVPLEFSCAAGAEGGTSSAVVTVKAQGPGDRSATAKLGIAWTVKRLYELEPARAFFGAADLGAGKRQRRVSIRRSDGKPFRVLQVRTRHRALAVTVMQSKAGLVQDLVVTIDPGQLADALWENVEITTDHPVQPSLRLAVAAFPTGSSTSGSAAR